MAASATWGARVIEASTSRMHSTSSRRPRCAADTVDGAAAEGPAALREGESGRPGICDGLWTAAQGLQPITVSTGVARDKRLLRIAMTGPSLPFPAPAPLTWAASVAWAACAPGPPQSCAALHRSAP